MSKRSIVVHKVLGPEGLSSNTIILIHCDQLTGLPMDPLKVLHKIKIIPNECTVLEYKPDNNGRRLVGTYQGKPLILTVAPQDRPAREL